MPPDQAWYPWEVTGYKVTNRISRPPNHHAENSLADAQCTMLASQTALNGSHATSLCTNPMIGVRIESTMGRRQGATQPSSDEPVAAIERRLALLETVKSKAAVPRDPFEEEEISPLERVDFYQRPIDPNVVRRLASMGVGEDELAEAFDIPVVQLREAFGHHIRIGRAQGRTALRRKQWQKAMQGNVTMLIHLGKNELGQNDVVDHKHSGKIELEDTSPKQQLMDLIREASIRMRGLDPSNEVPMPRLVSPEADSV